eukprot:1341143-Pleurochrysis_carterae.AAC.1
MDTASRCCWSDYREGFERQGWRIQTLQLPTYLSLLVAAWSITDLMGVGEQGGRCHTGDILEMKVLKGDINN